MNSKSREHKNALTLKIRPSEQPWEYKCEYGDSYCGDCNQGNTGTIMVGFDSEISGNTQARYTITLKEEKSTRASGKEYHNQSIYTDQSAVWRSL